MDVVADLTLIRGTLFWRKYTDQRGNVQIEGHTEDRYQSVMLYLRSEDVKSLQKTLDHNPIT